MGSKGKGQRSPEQPSGELQLQSLLGQRRCCISGFPGIDPGVTCHGSRVTGHVDILAMEDETTLAR